MNSFAPRIALAAHVVSSLLRSLTARKPIRSGRASP